MNVDSPASARRSLSLAKSGSAMYSLATDLDHRRWVRHVELERDPWDRPQVVGHVLADLAVAARGASLEHAVAVDQRDRQTVDLRLDHILEVRILDSLAREVVAHARDPGAQLVSTARVGQRQHRLRMADLDEIAHRLAAGALRRRIGRDQLGMLRLDRPQLVDQRVVLIIADLRIVEHVVAVAVVVELLAQLRRALVRIGNLGRAPRRAHPSTSLAAGAISLVRSCCCRASSPSRSVRSKWIGVSAILPRATAARSVSVSSCSKLASP